MRVHGSKRGSGRDKVYPSSGSLFFLLQAPLARSQRLVPLAVFTMHWGAAGVKSIQASNYGRTAMETARIRRHHAQAVSRRITPVHDLKR